MNGAKQQITSAHPLREGSSPSLGLRQIRLGNDDVLVKLSFGFDELNSRKPSIADATLTLASDGTANFG